MIFALISVLGNAINVLGTKMLFREKEVDFRNFLSVTILFIFVFANILYLILMPGYPVFDLPLIFWFSVMCLLALGFNSLYFYALSTDEVCDVVQIEMIRPLTTVILATLIFPSERNVAAVALTLIAGTALVVSRLEKHHFKPNRATLAMMGYVLLISFETQVVKILLETFNPVSMYVLRTGVLSVLFFIFLRPNIKKLKRVEYIQFVGIAFIVTIEFITRFYAIQTIGIVKTSLLFLLSPVIILFASRFLLKEKLTTKKAISDVIIVICVAALLLAG